MQAYRFVDLDKFPLTADSFYGLPPACRQEHDLILLARLGRITLGTLSLATGEVQVRRLAVALNLDALLRGVGQQLDDWRRDLRPAP